MVITVMCIHLPFPKTHQNKLPCFGPLSSLAYTLPSANSITNACSHRRRRVDGRVLGVAHQGAATAQDRPARQCVNHPRGSLEAVAFELDDAERRHLDGALALIPKWEDYLIRTLNIQTGG